MTAHPAEAPSPPPGDITAADVRRVTTLTAVAFVVLVAYWTLWFAARSVVASDTTASYYDFENAFPLADAWLALCLVTGTVLLHRRHRATLLWFLLGAGGGVYLFCMDVLYDVEHSIYTSGAGGVIELGINLLTLTLSVWFVQWAWRRRHTLLAFG